MRHILIITFFLLYSLKALSQTPNTSAATTTISNRYIDADTTLNGTDTFYGNVTRWNLDTSECSYNGWAINTHFNLPMIRYNFTPQIAGKSNLSFFNSAGLGIAINYGRIDISDENHVSLDHDNPDDRSIDFKNYIGLSIGCVFAVGSSSSAASSSTNNSSTTSTTASSSTTIFAPVVNLQILDLQVGIGYELGDVTNSAHRMFVALSYGISLSKLTDVGSWLLSNPTPYSVKDQTRDASVHNMMGAF